MNERNRPMKRLTSWVQRNSLWLVGMGLMLASSGIDGAYMARWMPADWLGYILNTTSDIAGEVLMYWFGRLQQERKGSKKQRLAWALIPAEVIAVAYSWFFSWRQLRLVLPAVEGDAAGWVAPIAAAFIPLLLAATGYAQALLAGRFIDATAVTDGDTDATVTQQSRDSDATVTLTITHYRAFVAAKVSQNGNDAAVSRESALEWASSAGMDVSTATGKANRDKVLRWWRTVTEETSES